MLMDSCPLTYEFDGAPWKFPLDNVENLYGDRRLILPVLNVKVWGRMVIPEHGYDDSVESRDSRHSSKVATGCDRNSFGPSLIVRSLGG
jgi:hypothetical protein